MQEDTVTLYCAVLSADPLTGLEGREGTVGEGRIENGREGRGRVSSGRVQEGKEGNGKEGGDDL